MALINLPQLISIKNSFPVTSKRTVYVTTLSAWLKQSHKRGGLSSGGHLYQNVRPSTRTVDRGVSHNRGTTVFAILHSPGPSREKNFPSNHFQEGHFTVIHCHTCSDTSNQSHYTVPCSNSTVRKAFNQSLHTSALANQQAPQLHCKQREHCTYSL